MADRLIARSDAGRTLANERKLPPLARLVQSLRTESIRFLVIGMSGAILQGVPVTTLDTDLSWNDAVGLGSTPAPGVADGASPSALGMWSSHRLVRSDAPRCGGRGARHDGRGGRAPQFNYMDTAKLCSPS
ncbi:MAG TPA: hypothetical protein PLX89_15730 [Verrucomicrobiota bacterium]|nr:hypothetical protein [Verrucomicrobiales bacterium]HRI14445.1 hypothetical protein [Verrucomicrobiota bacterium]